MNRVLAIAAALAVIIMGWYIFIRDPGLDPLLDENSMELADTHNEGFCSGKAFWISRGQGSTEEFSDCMGYYEDADDPHNQRDLSAVQEAFCQGIKSQGWDKGVPACLDILTRHRLWPTVEGTLTNAWNRAFPYPGDMVTSPPPSGDQSRTGDRDESERDLIGGR